MSNEKWTNVWEIMKNDRLEFDTIYNCDIFCVICKKVLINAHGGPCGCRYCLDCITKYLNGEEKSCPENSSYCRDELLNINKNIFIDQPMNIKLLKLIVKCPKKNCQFKDQLRNIEAHMRICNSQLINFPNLNMNMDCENSDTTSRDTKKLIIEINSERKNLFHLIDNLKNEIEIFKKDKVELEKSCKNLKECINDLQLQGKEIEENMKNKFIEEQKCITDLQLNYTNENIEIREKVKEMENKFLEEQRKSATKIEEINKTIMNLEVTYSKSISKLEDKVRILELKEVQQYEGEFVWRIENWSEKRNESKLFSDPFYSHRNGYKMRLSLYPKGSCYTDILGVFVEMLPGEYDFDLPWPFKRDIILELINQHTEQAHVIYVIEHDSPGNVHLSNYFSDHYYKIHNYRPKYSYEISGHRMFYKVEELSNNPALIDNDRIVIRCRVKKPRE